MSFLLRATFPCLESMGCGTARTIGMSPQEVEGLKGAFGIAIEKIALKVAEEGGSAFTFPVRNKQGGYTSLVPGGSKSR